MSDIQSRAPGGAYMNPYLAGVGLGLVLLAAFVVMGRGLGASGAFSSTVAWLMDLVAPAHAAALDVVGVAAVGAALGARDVVVGVLRPGDQVVVRALLEDPPAREDDDVPIRRFTLPATPATGPITGTKTVSPG